MHHRAVARRHRQAELAPDAEGQAPAGPGNGAMSRLLRSAIDDAPAQAPAGFDSQLPTGGQPVPGPARQDLETGLGAPLDSVRLHTGSTAAGLARQVNARAFTVGSNVYFGQGEYSPNSSSGYHLLAHEVTHTLQQGPGSAGTGPLPISTPDSPAERQADQVAHSLSQSRGTPASTDTVATLAHAAGNQAVGRLLARAPAPPAATPTTGLLGTTGPSTLADLYNVLAPSKLLEDNIIDILRRLGPEKVLIGTIAIPWSRFRGMSGLGMAKVVQILNVPLEEGLKRILEATEGGSVAYPFISEYVKSAPQSQRDLFKDEDRTAWFCTYFCNGDTVLAAVSDLGFDLRGKIHWIDQVGATTSLLAAAIDVAPAAQRAAVGENDAMMDYIQDMSRRRRGIVDLVVITRKLETYGTGDIETNLRGNEYHVGGALSRYGLTLTKTIRYTGAPEQLVINVADEINEGITTHLNDRWKLRIASPGGQQPGDGDYSIRFEVVEGDGYVIDIRQGNDSDLVGPNKARLYERPKVGRDQVVAQWVHSLCHAMIGAPEEAGTGPRKPSKREGGHVVSWGAGDNSIMGDVTKGNATKLEIKDRHLTMLIPWAQQFFPGRTVSIVR